MVDPVSFIGKILSLGTQKTGGQQNVERAEAKAPPARSNPRDEVVLSDKAISLAEAQRAAESVRESLAADPSQSLGLDPGFDTGA